MKHALFVMLMFSVPSIAFASPVQERTATGGRIGVRGGSAAGVASPLEKKCIQGFARLLKWKSDYASRISDAGSKEVCTGYTYEAEQAMPPPPVQCQYLTYGESSPELKSALSGFTGESGTTGAKVKMSTAYGNAMRSALRRMIDKCDAGAEAEEDSRAAMRSSDPARGGGHGPGRSPAPKKALSSGADPREAAVAR